MLAGYRKPAHADIFLGSRLAVPAALGVLAATFLGSNAIMGFLIAVGVGFFIPDFWLKWATDRRINQIRMSFLTAWTFLQSVWKRGLVSTRELCASVRSCM